MKVTTEKTGRWRRLGWFVLIWALSVATIAAVGYGLRAFISGIYGG
jgi:hypothetical protein